jgi:hypothetical protein
MAASSPARSRTAIPSIPACSTSRARSYLIYHNGTLTLPDGQTGAGARRSVAIEYLHYGADGSHPAHHTDRGRHQRAAPARRACAGHRLRPLGPTVRVQQFAQGYPTAWPGTPALASVADPFNQAPEPVGFNSDGGLSRIAQTFVPTADIALARISLYAGDGLGTGDGRSLRLSLRELGEAEGVDGGTELLGAPGGLAIAYQPQGAGLLSFELATAKPVLLKAGRRYVLELSGERQALTVYPRASRGDVYAAGAALGDGQPLKDKSGAAIDLAFALYGRP